MSRARLFSLPAALMAVTLAATAATAAFAYERVSKASDIVTMNAGDTLDLGIDLTITGPVGPGKVERKAELKAAQDADEQPLRRRMHLK